MITQISKTLRHWVTGLFIFTGLAIVVIGGSIVKLGAWLGDVKVFEEHPYDDITDDQLAQVIKEAQEAKQDDK